MGLELSDCKRQCWEKTPELDYVGSQKPPKDFGFYTVRRESLQGFNQLSDMI